jgi:hypothetical protein
MTTAWPVPDSPMNIAPSTHFTVAFMLYLCGNVCLPVVFDRMQIIP